MCGLVGVIGHIGHVDKKMFKWLLHFDETRGEHSTGIALVNDKSEIDVIKAVGDSAALRAEYPDRFDSDRMIKDHSLKALIGHNRWATVGAKTAENAHPFHHYDIVGAHNGTLRNTHRLSNFKKFEVDSEAVFYNIATMGFEDAMKELDGAWALTFYDKNENTMNFIRNHERTLYYCFDKGESVMYWASMEWMLEMAAYYSKVQIGDIQSFDPNHLYEMKLDKLSIRDCSWTRTDKTYEGYKHPPYNYSGGRSNVGPFGIGVVKDAIEANVNYALGRLDGLGEKDKVFTFVGATEDENSLKKMNEYVGKEIEFFFNCEYKDDLGINYLSAESTVGGEYWEIRVYYGDHPRTEEFKKAIDSGVTYTAKVKKIAQRVVKGRGDKVVHYMLLDMRTLKKEDEPEPVDDIPMLPAEMDRFLERKETTATSGHTTPDCDCSDTFWDPEGTYTGYQEKQLTYTEFVAATSRGCNWCGDTAFNIHPPKSLAWVAPSEFVCPICNTDGIVKQVYPHLK